MKGRSGVSYYNFQLQTDARHIEVLVGYNLPKHKDL